jgi:hypothetical protein
MNNIFKDRVKFMVKGKVVPVLNNAPCQAHDLGGGVEV